MFDNSIINKNGRMLETLRIWQLNTLSAYGVRKVSKTPHAGTHGRLRGDSSSIEPSTTK